MNIAKSSVIVYNGNHDTVLIIDILIIIDNAFGLLLLGCRAKTGCCG